MNEIQQYMINQFHPKRFVVRERLRYWSNMKRKSGEIVQELAARIRQAAATWDFANIENPLDEALRTRFICSINNEAVLKALFKINDDELNFEKAVQIATKIEEAAIVAKEIVYGTSSNVYSSTVAQVSKKRNFVKKPATNSPTSNDNTRKCYRCSNSNPVVLKLCVATPRCVVSIFQRRRGIFSICAIKSRFYCVKRTLIVDSFLTFF